MLQPTTIRFLKDLKKNNDKAWFDAHRKAYEAAKADFESLVAAVLKKIAAFDSTVSHLQPKDCTFRINRDVRFSKNKAPYKTNMAMYISKGGKKAMDCAGYYFHLEPGSAFIAGGMWMPMAPELKLIRQEIDYCLPEFDKMIKSAKIRKAFGSLETEGVLLTRPPKGYQDDNPAIEYLKLKSFILSAKIADDQLKDPKLADTIAQCAKTMQPLLQFLNRALDTAKE